MCVCVCVCMCDRYVLAQNEKLPIITAKTVHFRVRFFFPLSPCVRTVTISIFFACLRSIDPRTSLSRRLDREVEYFRKFAFTHTHTHTRALKGVAAEFYNYVVEYVKISNEIRFTRRASVIVEW